MKRIKPPHLGVMIIMVILNLESGACIVPSSQIVSGNSDKFFSESDIVFFGRLNDEFIDEDTMKQTANFTVIKNYKGNARENVTVINMLTSSCSWPFQNDGSAYYVYAQMTEKESTYLIDGFASFVSLEDAQRYSWSP